MTATGTLKFAALSTFAQFYVAPIILSEFLALHPSISLDLRLTDMELDLMLGSFDLALQIECTYRESQDRASCHRPMPE